MTMAIAKASVARKEPHEGRLEDRQHASTCSRMCRALGMGRLRLLKAQQAPAEHEEVRQCARDHKPMPVLGQAAVAHLGEAEDAFDHADRMLDPGAHAGLPPIRRSGGAGPRAPMGEVARVGRAHAEHRGLAGVTSTEWMSLLWLSTPKCPFMPKYHCRPFCV